MIYKKESAIIFSWRAVESSATGRLLHGRPGAHLILRALDRLAGECATKTALNVRYTGVIQIHDRLCND